MIRELIEYRSLIRRRSWSTEKKRARQSYLLNKLVVDTYKNVPFYRELYDKARINPQNIVKLSDLNQLPLISKTDLQTASTEALKGGTIPKQARMVHTSGSTGNPLWIYFSKDEQIRRRVRFEISQNEVGSRFWHRRVQVGGLHNKPRTVWDYFPGWMTPVTRCSVDDAIEVVHRIKPHVIRGLVSQLQLFSMKIHQEGITGIRPELVLTGGEMLTHQTRLFLEETFHCPVRPVYASWEFSGIASWCRLEKGYHLVSDDLIVEVD